MPISVAVERAVVEHDRLDILDEMRPICSCSMMTPAARVSPLAVFDGVLEVGGRDPDADATRRRRVDRHQRRAGVDQRVDAAAVELEIADEMAARIGGEPNLAAEQDLGLRRRDRRRG